MKKYNKKTIMMKAWEIRRRLNVTMSVALKDAWSLEKALKRAEEVAAEIDWNTSIKVNDWAKGGHDRTYVEVAVYTNAWNRKRTEKIGYINNLTGEYIAA